MADQLFGMQPSKEESFLGEEETGKLYSSTVDGVTIGIPASAFLAVIPLIAFLIFVLRSGLLDKFKSSSSYVPLPEYSSSYEPPSYGAPPLEGYGPSGQPLDVIVCIMNEFTRHLPNDNKLC